MNDYFVNITETLGISKNAENVSPVIEDTDLVERAIRKSQSHPSILRIRANVNEANDFDFQKTSVMEVEKQIRKLKPKKASPCGRVPAKILKAQCRGANWLNKTIKKKRIRQGSVISLYSEIQEDDNDLIPFILETKYDPRA